MDRSKSSIIYCYKDKKNALNLCRKPLWRRHVHFSSLEAVVIFHSIACTVVCISKLYSNILTCGLSAGGYVRYISLYLWFKSRARVNCSRVVVGSVPFWEFNISSEASKNAKKNEEDAWSDFFDPSMAPRCREELWNDLKQFWTFFRIVAIQSYMKYNVCDIYIGLKSPKNKTNLPYCNDVWSGISVYTQLSNKLV